MKGFLMSKVMTDLFEVQIVPNENRIIVHFNATPGSSFARSISRKLLRYGPDNRNCAFEAIAHQLEQGSLICEGVNSSGKQVGSKISVDSYPSLKNKVFFDEDCTIETESIPQENINQQVV